MMQSQIWGGQQDKPVQSSVLCICIYMIDDRILLGNYL